MCRGNQVSFSRVVTSLAISVLLLLLLPPPLRFETLLENHPPPADNEQPEVGREEKNNKQTALFVLQRDDEKCRHDFWTSKTEAEESKKRGAFGLRFGSHLVLLLLFCFG